MKVAWGLRLSVLFFCRWERWHFDDMDTRNSAFVGKEKGFGRSSDQCDVGLGLRMQQVEESCPNNSFMPMPHHHHHHHNSSNHQLSSSSCCCGDGFDEGACDGGPIVCNTSNQVSCTGDVYDVVGAASVSAAAVVLKSLHHHPFSADTSFPHDSSGKLLFFLHPLTSIHPFSCIFL